MLNKVFQPLGNGTKTKKKIENRKKNTKLWKTTKSENFSSESMGCIVHVHEVVGLRNTAPIYQ